MSTDSASNFRPRSVSEALGLGRLSDADPVSTTTSSATSIAMLAVKPAAASSSKMTRRSLKGG